MSTTRLTPTPGLDQAVLVRIGGADVAVPSRASLLIDKLRALLSRAEPRDLVDVAFLLQQGEDLEAAVARAPERDAGFSALTLAWVLRNLPLAHLGPAAGWDAETLKRMQGFRRELVGRLVAGRP